MAYVDLDTPTLAPLSRAFYDQSKQRHAEPEFKDWLARYAARVRRDGLLPAEQRARMHGANPREVLRNYLAQQAIDRAEAGDDRVFTNCSTYCVALTTTNSVRSNFAQRRSDWARQSGLFDAVLQLLNC